MLAPATDDVLRDVRALARAGLRGTWYRGARFPPRERPTSADLARPSGRAGRFHRAGEHAFYFARTLDVARAEAPPPEGDEAERDGEAGAVLWVQRFDLDLPDVRVVARPPRASGGRHAALLGLWAKADELASGRDDYALTHRLADAARACGIEAILYASDEAADDAPEVNLAVLGEAARRVARMTVGAPERA